MFSFLNLPTSAHTTALGGKNVSLIRDDVSLSFQNPALLSCVSNHTLAFGFLSFMKGAKAGNVSYAQLHGTRGTWGVNAQFVGYGSMEETTTEGISLGNMHARDMAFSGLYSYGLSDTWMGGVAGKIIYSHYGEFSSCAIAVDLGLNYYLEENDFSLSAVARNLGGQVKRFADHRESLPFDLEVGFTKGLGHAPVSLSVTMTDLTRWRSNNYYSSTGHVSGGRIFTNHFNVGVDIKPSKMVYVAAGFNFRRAYEMKAAGSSRAAGLSFGTGVELSRIKFGLAYAKYHVGAPALQFNVAYNFNK